LIERAHDYQERSFPPGTQRHACEVSAIVDRRLPSVGESFAIYFVDRQRGQSWPDAVPNSGTDEVDVDMQPLDAAAVATWDLVKPLAPVLPDAEEFAVEVNRELNDDAIGIQVSIFGATSPSLLSRVSAAAAPRRSDRRHMWPP
jgi:hypothetical protein